ncbi:hypothetical protein [Lacticaseibacillus zhaodongensis]|uniref:hypothetical protein n=1 Tax=Lacticaseibacillus zhaodongensis TaxID=2668065 RepID=UPI0012D30E7A|nr:hypothetical protein [Lacticaseibacillus zhaodongensis]
MTYFQTFIDHLPSSLNKAGTNIQKIARFVTEPLDDASSLLNQVEAWRNIDKAEGKALDKLGQKYGQLRGQADDEFYRLMIKSKIIVRTGDVTVDGVLRAIQSSLNADPTGIKLETLRPGPKDDGEPLAIKVEGIPLSIAPNEWEQEYLINRVRQSVAAGVRVADINFTVTTPAYFYVGSLAREDREIHTRSDLLDDRIATVDPTGLYLAVFASMDRTIETRSDLLDDRSSSVTAGQMANQGIARTQRTQVVPSDVLSNRQTTATGNACLGTAAQSNVLLTTDATYTDSNS